MTGLLDHMRTHNTPPRLLAALRALVRKDTLWLIALAALVGVLAGGVVSLMTLATFLAHHLLAPGFRPPVWPDNRQPCARPAGPHGRRPAAGADQPVSGPQNPFPPG
nr:hypothetical protein [Acetobacter malorum]